MTVEKIKALLDACYQAKRARELLPALPKGVTSSYIQYLDAIERLEREGMWQVVSSCAKKRRYVTYDQARAVVRHREREGGEPLFIYRCEHCGGWHITHQADQQRYGREAGRAAEERLARQAAQQAVGPAPRFAVDDLVIDVASGMPCVVVAVGEQGGEPAYELSSADGAFELGWVRESDVSEA